MGSDRVPSPVEKVEPHPLPSGQCRRDPIVLGVVLERDGQSM